MSAAIVVNQSALNADKGSANTVKRPWATT